MKQFELLLGEIESMLEDKQDFDACILSMLRRQAQHIGILHDMKNQLAWLRELWAGKDFESAIRVVDAMYTAR